MAQDAYYRLRRTHAESAEAGPLLGFSRAVAGNYRTTRRTSHPYSLVLVLEGRWNCMAMLIKRSPRESGASIAIYALAVAVVAVALIGAVRVLGSNPESSLDTAASAPDTSDLPGDEDDVPSILAMIDDSPAGRKSDRSFSSGPVGSISQGVDGVPYCLGGRVQLVQQPCDRSLEGSFQAQRDIESGTLKLEIAGKCLGVNSLKNDKAQVVAQACFDDDPSQDWTYDQRGRFVNEYSNKCLDVDKSGKTLRAVRQGVCTESATQVWTAPLPD